MSEQTAEEVRREYLEKMGSELGELHYACRNECIILHWKWYEYAALFGSSPERVDLLNTAAPGFFYIVQDCMWEDILLHIARMTSPPKSAGKANLTLTQLPTLVSSELRLQVGSLVQAAVDRCEFARDWRNRRIAHRDLGLALDKHSAPLFPASRQSVSQGLEAICEVLNCLEKHYCNSAVAYDFFEPLGGAEVLVRVLKDGLEMRERRKDWCKSGRAPFP